LVAQGEKNRVVSASFGSEASPEETRPPAPPAPAEGGLAIPTSAFVFGGVGVVALGVFAVLGIKGTLDLQDLRDTCEGHCAESDVDAVRVELHASDVALLVGVVSIGVATVLVLTVPRRAAPAAAALLGPGRDVARGGGFAVRF
jgi:hypothetical protein